MLFRSNADGGGERGEREKGTVQQIMWIIIPGQRLDERETLTHHALMQPGTPVETNGGEREKQGWMSGSLDGESKATLALLTSLYF